jgi:hypothetical protein
MNVVVIASRKPRDPMTPTKFSRVNVEPKMPTLRTSRRRSSRNAMKIVHRIGSRTAITTMARVGVMNVRPARFSCSWSVGGRPRRSPRPAMRSPSQTMSD